MRGNEPFTVIRPSTVTVKDVLSHHHGGRFKLGLDFHGVVDKFPVIFIDLAKSIHRGGGEVHVLTGSPDDAKLEKELLSLNAGKRWWDRVFSITDHLLAKGITYRIDSIGGKVFPDSDWDSAKAEYCEKNGISVHIDDSETFLKHFKTACLLFKQG
nr:hypothetical protein [Candidatus Sigynarchaeota archaeon]